LPVSSLNSIYAPLLEKKAEHEKGGASNNKQQSVDSVDAQRGTHNGELTFSMFQAGMRKFLDKPVATSPPKVQATDSTEGSVPPPSKPHKKTESVAPNLFFRGNQLGCRAHPQANNVPSAKNHTSDPSFLRHNMSVADIPHVQSTKHTNKASVGLLVLPEPNSRQNSSIGTPSRRKSSARSSQNSTATWDVRWTEKTVENAASTTARHKSRGRRHHETVTAASSAIGSLIQQHALHQAQNYTADSMSSTVSRVSVSEPPWALG